ncbi:hypothetical protein FLA_2987 [Filimonas lacunae]|nr:hypothetical protein FLA_2987 [Filimonas lacunae]
MAVIAAFAASAQTNVNILSTQSSINYLKSVAGGNSLIVQDIKVPVEFWGAAPTADMPVVFTVTNVSSTACGVQTGQASIVNLPVGGYVIPKASFSNNRDTIFFVVHIATQAVAPLALDEYFDIKLASAVAAADPLHRVLIQPVAWSATTNTPKALPAPIIEFVGDANVQKSLTNGSGLPANTGIGVIYREALPARYGILHSIEVSMTVNVASTADTLKTIYNDAGTITNKSEFGNSVLLPTNSGQAFGFSLRGYLTKRDAAGTFNRGDCPEALWGFISGGYISFEGSNRNWYDTKTATATKGANMSLHAGIFHEFMKRDVEIRRDYSITLGVGYTQRWLAGDVARNEADELRKQILGSTQLNFSGMEISLGLRLKNIKAEIWIPILSKKGQVPGLSGAQPYTYIGFTGGFPLKLN